VNSTTPQPSRRSFLAYTAAFATGMPLLAQSAPTPSTVPPDRATINILGPKPGYTPQIGTLVSMLTWMQRAIIAPTRKLTQSDLDYLFDKEANSIGGLMLHLAATETYYQRHTFNGEAWGKWPADISAKWDAAMKLGDAGRATIKGHNLAFYTDALNEVRERSLAEFRKRDDAWLMTVDQDWPWGPTNNYCKWFHVCEHISHHAGQIDLLLKRLPGYKPNT
jgi:uncharacterized damage-inducible protein DinB